MVKIKTSMKEKILIIPGNPSVNSYYELWSKKLCEISKCEVIVIHHISVTDKHKQLDDYTKAYEQFVLSQVNDELKPILIGHSIGGFFAREIFKRNKDKFKNLILVFPYFGDENLKGLGLLNLTKFLAPRPLLKNKSLRFILKLGPFCNALNNITFSELDNGVKLGQLEKDYFKNKENRIRKEEAIDSCTDFLYTNNDNWCTSRTVERIRTLNIRDHELKSVHDFVLKESEIIKVNQKINTLLTLNKGL